MHLNVTDPVPDTLELLQSGCPVRFVNIAGGEYALKYFVPLSSWLSWPWVSEMHNASYSYFQLSSWQYVWSFASRVWLVTHEVDA